MKTTGAVLDLRNRKLARYLHKRSLHEHDCVYCGRTWRNEIAPDPYVTEVCVACARRLGWAE